MRSLLALTNLIIFLLGCTAFIGTGAYDPIDPTGNITVNWDVISWTPDGYVATVTITNYQRYRHVQSPGWSLGWTWSGREMIWAMVGARALSQGDCSLFKGYIPHSCKKSPVVVDLKPNTPYSQQVENCCRGGVISSWLQDKANAVSSFQLSVGQAGTTSKTIRIPRNFTLTAPGPSYTCHPTTIVRPTKFITPDGKRFTQALMTWRSTCLYIPSMAPKKYPSTCCVSLSTLGSKKTLSCPTCACNCHRGISAPSGKLCTRQNTTHSSSSLGKPNRTPVLQCTNHMCPITVNWDVKHSYRHHWSVQITVTNFNNHVNYSQWNLVAKHPNFNHLNRVIGFHYRSIRTRTNDTGMFWGTKSHNNEVLLEAGSRGYVQAELIFGKKRGIYFSLKNGWPFPRMIYFNGDTCSMPSQSDMNSLFRD